MVERLPSRLLRLEGLAVAVGALVLYFHEDYSWLLLLLLILAPDLSMLGYLGGTRVGAVSYDTVHTTATPIALGLVGVLADSGIAIQIALIWLATSASIAYSGMGSSTRQTSRTRISSVSKDRRPEA